MPRSISRLVLSCCILLAARSAFAAPTITKGPYLQNARTNAVVIMWETSDSSNSKVQYGPTTSYGQTISNSTSTRLHEIALSGLTTDTLYHYKVTSAGSTGTVASADSTFRTAVATTTPFRFAAYGDSRTFASSHAAVVKAIVARAPRLVLHTGDITRDGTVASYWQTEYFAPAKPLIATTPLYPSLGNHEKGTTNYYTYFSHANATTEIVWSTAASIGSYNVVVEGNIGMWKYVKVVCGGAQTGAKVFTLVGK